MQELDEKKSVVHLVVDSIVQDIIDRRLSPGDRIPTEPELCDKLGVGRNSVREAIKQLEAHGVVCIRRADGTFISEHYTQKMLDPILYSMILQKNCWADFVELRRVLDIGTLHVVAVRAERLSVLPKLTLILEEMERETERDMPRVGALIDCDTRFHDLITACTENPQLGSISDYITRITIPSRTQTLERVIATGHCANLVALHRQLFGIIAEGRVDLIDSAVADHYMYWK